MPKIEINMSRVGEPSHKQYELIWKIEEILGEKFEGDTFEEASQFIDEHLEDYSHELAIRDLMYDDWD